MNRKGRIVRGDEPRLAVNHTFGDTTDILYHARHADRLSFANSKTIGLSRIAAIEQRTEPGELRREFSLGQRIAQHHTLPVLNLGLPDHFIEHGTREELLAEIGLDCSGIIRAVQKRLRGRDLDMQIARKL